MKGKNESRASWWGERAREKASEREREREEAGKKQRGKSMTGNLAICRTEIGSHLNRLSKRKADFTADGLAVAALWTPGAQPA